MAIRFQQLNPGACRTYLLGKPGITEVALVDPVLDRLDAYLTFLRRENLKLVAVVDTHTHADHISAGPALRDLTGCDYIMHAAAPAGCASRRLLDGQALRLAGLEMRVMHTPGHTGDAVCLVLPDRVLTGDTLFLDDGGAGRDDLPGGDAGAHWHSLQRLLALPEGLVVYPAHEYRQRAPSSLAVQKGSNPHLRPRTREEFIHYIQELRLGPAGWMKEVLRANYACALEPGKVWIPVDAHACEARGTLGKGANEQVVVTIDPGELRPRLERDDRPVLLDVRERSELAGALGHLPGIVHIPIDELSRRLAELEAYRQREIVTVCRSGGRSHTAAQILQQAGFAHVHSLEGGMLAWRARGLPAGRQDSGDIWHKL
ncbi:MAG: MBL fold metallo-hydrolase [Euryarchaeota archaeon]|nr:MBL fold metallo-hydrolase [Euryarchaeota archaeon]